MPTGGEVTPNVLKENLPASTIFYGDEAAGPDGVVETPSGGGINGLKSDAEGNLTVNKDLGVDGKLTLKSLVSTSNPDGDITKELGGGGGSTLYEYSATFLDQSNLGIKAYGKFYSSVDIGQENKVRASYELYDKLLPGGSEYELSLILVGHIKIDTKYYSLCRMTFGSSHIYLHYFDPERGIVQNTRDFRYDTTNTWNVVRNIASPRSK